MIEFVNENKIYDILDLKYQKNIIHIIYFLFLKTTVT